MLTSDYTYVMVRVETKKLDEHPAHPDETPVPDHLGVIERAIASVFPEWKAEAFEPNDFTTQEVLEIFDAQCEEIREDAETEGREYGEEHALDNHECNHDECYSSDCLDSARAEAVNDIASSFHNWQGWTDKGFEVMRQSLRHALAEGYVKTDDPTLPLLVGGEPIVAPPGPDAEDPVEWIMKALHDSLSHAWASGSDTLPEELVYALRPAGGKQLFIQDSERE